MKHVKVKRGRAFSLALAASLTAALGVPAIALAAEDVDPAVQVVEAQGASAASFDQNGLERSGEVAATVGGVEYATLNEALAAAKDGQTVKVLANTTMTTGRVEGVSITLDLNGCAVEADNRAFNVVKGGRLTLDDTAGGGVLKVNKIGSTLSLGIVTGSKGSVVMKGGTLEVPEYGIYTTNDDTGAYVSMQGGLIKADYGICSIGNGTEHSAKVEVSGGEIRAGIFGFGTNGSNGNGGVDFVMTGGTITSVAEDAPALYLPAYYSTATITGGTITGGTGIEIRAGELSVSGDARISGVGPLESNPNGSGSTSSGAGIAVAQHATKQPINVTISDNAKVVGTVALHESNPQKNDSEAIDQVKIAVTGGALETSAPDAAQAVYSEDCTGFVTGGVFNTELPGAVLADDSAMLVNEEGSVSVMSEADAVAGAGAFVEKDGKKVYYTTSAAAENANPGTSENIEVFAVEVNGQKFATLKEGIAAAKNGGTVTLLSDLGSDQVSAGKDKYINITESGTKVTIDLAGHAITLDNADTISVSAPDVTLTVKNGTIVNTNKDSYGLYTYATNDNITVALEDLTLQTIDQAIGVQGLNSNQNVTLKNCNITCETTAVYWPPKSGTLTIEDTSIEAKSGVTIKGGSVVVKGDTHIKAAGEKKIPEDYYDGSPSGNLISTGAAIYVESGYNDRDISLDIQGGTFESEKGATVLYFAKEGESTTVSRDIAISGGTFVGEPPAAEFIVAGVGLQLDKDGNMVAVSAQLVPNADKVVDGAYVYDVASGKEITEADLLALMGMNVDVEKSGYTIKVDAANLAALNKAIGAKDTSATFDFAYTAVKDGAQVLADGDAVDSVTVTVKLTDSSKPAGGNGDGSAAAPGNDDGPTATPSNGDANAPSKNKASKGSMPATADGAAGIAGAAVLVGTAAAAAGAVALKRRERQ
ncbi:hypothetical protein [uncultured Slackia sp.]|uniref:hypothetical protein n=1 Tax=uncultured Slackia sp. TaxID=665903 RepID=UPI00280BDE8F|nr:hypothetical protein [uncultured Slackia sp.]